MQALPLTVLFLKEHDSAQTMSKFMICSWVCISGICVCVCVCVLEGPDPSSGAWTIGSCFDRHKYDDVSDL